MHLWNIFRFVCRFRSASVSQSSLGTGKYPINTVARFEICLRSRFGRLPIVRYTGCAFLSPAKFVNRVSSEATIHDMTVAYSSAICVYGR